MGPLGRRLFNSRWRARSQTRTIAPTWLRLGGSLTGCRGLEVGCGCGVGIDLLLSSMNAAEVQAIDLDPVMVALAARRVRKRASVITGDMGALPIADCSYDAVVGFGALHLADDWRRQLGETARVLRPGGRLYFEQPINPAARWAVHRPGGGRVPGGFGESELLQAIRHVGLCTIGLARVGPGGLDLIGVARKQDQPGASSTPCPPMSQ